MHADAPTPATEPAAHGRQWPAPASEYVSVGHMLHMVDPANATEVPAGHIVQTIWSTARKIGQRHPENRNRCEIML